MQADVIMALAGSNGGSWSTAFSPKSGVKMVNDGNLHSGENETGAVNNVAFPQDLHGKLSITASSSHAMVSGDRVTTTAGMICPHSFCHMIAPHSVVFYTIIPQQ